MRTPTDDMKQSVVVASGSDETRSYTPRDAANISEAIKEREHYRDRGDQGAGEARLRDEAQNLLNLVKLRVSGDYLQTSAMVRNGKSSAP